MSQYIGKICPFCKTPFRPEDEVVVCSSCDMPHHKDCWIENQGCTTFGCSGTIHSADGTPNAVTTTQLTYDEPAAPGRFCNWCGKPVVPHAAFCSHCGGALHPAPQQPVPQPVYQQPVHQQPVHQQPVHQQPIPQQPVTPPPPPTGNDMGQIFYMLLGSNQQYYLNRFNQLHTSGSRVSWNWVAFFFPAFWLMYRKLYPYGWAYVGAGVFVSILDLALGVPLFSVLFLSAAILVGLFGNYLYKNRFDEKVSIATKIEPAYRASYLYTDGGTNVALAIVAQIIVGLF